MEDQNIILFLDKIKKLIELGNKPKAVTEIESLELVLTREITKKKKASSLFQYLSPHPLRLTNQTSS